MGQHSVDVHQLVSRSDGKSYLNVLDGQGHIAVWTMPYSERYTFLVFKGHTVTFIQFDDIEWAREWFTENRSHIDDLHQIVLGDYIFIAEQDIREWVNES